MLATKDNREVRITADQRGAFEKEGYLVYDAETLKLLTEDRASDDKALKLEIVRLESQVESLSKDYESLKKAKGFELTNDQLKDILKRFEVEFKEKDNKDTLQTLLLNALNPLGEV